VIFSFLVSSWLGRRKGGERERLVKASSRCLQRKEKGSRNCRRDVHAIGIGNTAVKEKKEKKKEEGRGKR